MIIDGRRVAAELALEIRTLVERRDKKPKLGILVVRPDSVIESFVRIKKKFAALVGITVIERRFDNAATTEELCRVVRELAAECDGVVVQLPLPPDVDEAVLLNSVPVEKDVDMLSRAAVAAFRRGDSPTLPPVAGAVQVILERSAEMIPGNDVLILGHGRLVGAPVALFFRHNNAQVTVVDKPIPDLQSLTREADIIVCGVGKPGLITPNMIKRGSVIIDAGTSEAGGKIVGDATPDVAEVAGVFTPVPGGVGPIAVAMLFKNLYIRARSDPGL